MQNIRPAAGELGYLPLAMLGARRWDSWAAPEAHNGETDTLQVIDAIAGVGFNVPAMLPASCPTCCLGHYLCCGRLDRTSAAMRAAGAEC